MTRVIPLSDVSVDSAEYRTRVWVSVLLSETSSRANLDDVSPSEDAGDSQRLDMAPVPSAGIVLPESVLVQLPHNSSQPDPVMAVIIKTSDTSADYHQRTCC